MYKMKRPPPIFSLFSWGKYIYPLIFNGFIYFFEFIFTIPPPNSRFFTINFTVFRAKSPKTRD